LTWPVLLCVLSVPCVPVCVQMFSKALSIVKKTKEPEKFFKDWAYLTYLVFEYARTCITHYTPQTLSLRVLD
jgi:hypothetical protein